MSYDKGFIESKKRDVVFFFVEVINVDFRSNNDIFDFFIFWFMFESKGVE